MDICPKCRCRKINKRPNGFQCVDCGYEKVLYATSSEFVQKQQYMKGIHLVKEKKKKIPKEQIQDIPLNQGDRIVQYMQGSLR